MTSFSRPQQGCIQPFLSQACTCIEMSNGIWTNNCWILPFPLKTLLSHSLQIIIAESRIDNFVFKAIFYLWIPEKKTDKDLILVAYGTAIHWRYCPTALSHNITRRRGNGIVMEVEFIWKPHVVVEKRSAVSHRAFKMIMATWLWSMSNLIVKVDKRSKGLQLIPITSFD